MTETEITKLQKAIRIYGKHLDNEPKFLKAEKHLRKVQELYGTIDVNRIKDMGFR
tara:strand:- start:968 stop:1132 length:165 start_codon:yes stop_codon:yes gene_type:complete